VFLSHSSLDLHFAGRVRLALSQAGFKGWMAEAELRNGDWLFESIREALQRSHGMLVLLTVHSLSSAWVYTEIETWARGDPLREHAPMDPKKRIGMVVDGNDGDLTDLFALWDRNPTRFNHQCQPLKPLKALNERFGRVASRPRADKFVSSAILLLQNLSRDYIDFAFYPTHPENWTGGKERFKDFESLMSKWAVVLGGRD
jgi:hypothetical protein